MSKESILATKRPETKRENSVSKSRNTEPSQPLSSPLDHILFLQRTIGNQAVQRLIKSGVLQAKLRIGQPNDIYEQEADRVAEQVMRMPEPKIMESNAVSEQTKFPSIQRTCTECEEDLHRRPVEEETLQRKKDSGYNPEVTPNFESQINSLRGVTCAVNSRHEIIHAASLLS